MELELKTDFAAFWEIYPRKQGDKASIEKKFNKLSEVDRYNAIQNVRSRIETDPQWQDKQFIPMPGTYINQKRWLDEVIEHTDAKTRVNEAQGESPAHTVWSAMTEMYGDNFIKKHGEVPTPIWSSMLKNMPIVRIKRGLRTTFNSGSDFPPSLPKFMEYCKMTFEEEHPLALPKPPANKKLAFEAFEEVLKILRRK